MILLGLVIGGGAFAGLTVSYNNGLLGDCTDEETKRIDLGKDLADHLASARPSKARVQELIDSKADVNQCGRLVQDNCLYNACDVFKGREGT